MANLGLILQVFAFVLALLAAFVAPLALAPWRVHFGWLALAFFIASFIFGR